MDINVNFSMDEEPEKIDANFRTQVVQEINRDYNKLENKPSINGTELIGNYDEIDPTVPSWAKEPFKPEYNLDEVASEMSFADIKDAWDSIFT